MGWGIQGISGIVLEFWAEKNILKDEFKPEHVEG